MIGVMGWEWWMDVVLGLVLILVGAAVIVLICGFFPLLIPGG